jgi:hypothetical protein
MATQETVRIGAGAGTSDDRMVPALELAERGDIDYLVFECLAERTVSRENLARSKDPNLGYSPSLHARLRMVLPACMRNGIRIVSNMGAANPLGGARAARKEAADLGLGDVPVAVVLGDDVSSIVKHRPELRLIENGEPLESLVPKMISANAYLGADVVCEALNTGAPIVLSGRVACTEQLIYEIHDPTAYITPDCVLDITGIALKQEAADRVRVEGARAKPATETYKVNVGYADGYIGEGEVSYGGIDAIERAKWAAEIVKERLKLQGFVYDDFRVDLIGMSSLHGEVDKRPEPYEVRLRMAGRTRERKAAHAIGFEVRAMHMHGPGGAGGAIEPRVRDVLAVKSVLLLKNQVNAQVVVEGTL